MALTSPKTSTTMKNTLRTATTSNSVLLKRRGSRLWSLPTSKSRQIPPLNNFSWATWPTSSSLCSKRNRALQRQLLKVRKGDGHVPAPWLQLMLVWRPSSTMRLLGATPTSLSQRMSTPSPRRAAAPQALTRPAMEPVRHPRWVPD